MKFSICSWTFGNDTIENIMRFVARSGYDAIEIRAAVGEYNWQELLSLSKDLSLEIGGLTGDTSFDEKDLAHSNPANRQKAVDHFKRQIEAVKEVEGKYLVVCPSAVGKSALIGKQSDVWNWAVESVQALTDTASDLDVNLIIEPLNRYESCIVNTAQDALQFVKDVAHPKVRTMLDTYHMNIEEKDMESPFATVKDVLEIVHVADSNRQALGRGHIPFKQVISGIQKAGFDGTIVVECCAPGADPFRADKGLPTMEWIYKYAQESIEYLKKSFIV